ncbi:MAG: carbonic anhydrase [Waterburya sp.]
MLHNKISKLISRRHWLKIAGITGVSMLATNTKAFQTVASAQTSQPEVSQPGSADEALKRLLDGNRRFMQQMSQNPDRSIMRIHEVSQAQHPFAAFLSCADSRVPPEVVFDEGIGDLFDIRIPGNIVTTETLGSLEYATEVLEVQLIVVLGHERCGAVIAAVEGEELPGHIKSFVKAIEPVVATASNKEGDRVDNAVIANINYQIERIKQNSDLINQKLSSGKLKIIGGRYDLDTGEVKLIKD